MGNRIYPLHLDKDKVHSKTEESKKVLLKSNVVFSAVVHIHRDPGEQSWPRDEGMLKTDLNQRSPENAAN